MSFYNWRASFSSRSWIELLYGKLDRCSLSGSEDSDDRADPLTADDSPPVESSGGNSDGGRIKSWMRGPLLGSGSLGTVYEGINEDGFFFAVQEVPLLDQGSNANQCIIQLEQEIALLSQFEHDNIVQYFGYEKEEAKLYIFLELVNQGSLASLYQKYHLRDSQVSAYTRQILSGLKYLHDRNVVHRDIKCANILVSSNGSVKLADFGLAKEITKLDVLKYCKGNVYWMAPEVVNPKCYYGPAADIWSLGCTVLEMLTRQVPYPNLEWTRALFKIGRGEKPPIPNILSKDARDFIQKCVQFNPDERPTASELMEHPFIKTSLSASTSPDVSLLKG
ncbi:Mitogen-activated protein kinase kinase kinase protein [Dioscorea alata]|uniref:Mitogen-activated protein kinase kinase kinase protein n=2 Tax=Dioscorea alata TaxID=55571 RepID=A0ACB7U379_DIOAL|nr:Mitogen-activated protein kinase kinase kinase protein [Dioscorea alata]KAH7654735.1 Mitogen-activated protein kinase kinase kinase protein [Dioscorea alata]